MKPIKITEANAGKIASELDRINGNATEHTYTSADIIAIAERAEARLEKAGVAKKNRIGIFLGIQSGGKMPSAYKYTRLVNRGMLERRGAGWYLTKIEKVNVWPSQHGYEILALHEAAKNDIINHVCEV